MMIRSSVVKKKIKTKVRRGEVPQNVKVPAWTRDSLGPTCNPVTSITSDE
jgi:hypothetical protein